MNKQISIRMKPIRKLPNAIKARPIFTETGRVNISRTTIKPRPIYTPTGRINLNYRVNSNYKVNKIIPVQRPIKPRPISRPRKSIGSTMLTVADYVFNPQGAFPSTKRFLPSIRQTIKYFRTRKIVSNDARTPAQIEAEKEFLRDAFKKKDRQQRVLDRYEEIRRQDAERAAGINPPF